MALHLQTNKQEYKEHQEEEEEEQRRQEEERRRWEEQQEEDRRRWEQEQGEYLESTSLSTILRPQSTRLGHSCFAVKITDPHREAE